MQRQPLKHGKVQLRVKEMAESRNLSDRELAHAARLDVRVVRRMYENDWQDLRLDQLAKVAYGLRVRVADIIDEQ